MDKRTWLQIAVIVSICAFLFFFGLGAFGLVGADEPRYAQIGREMLTRHSWIVPTLNGQPWLEKPVFLYWQIANSYAVLGISDWAARVPAAFHALALVLAVFFFMRRFRSGTEMDAALITASSAAMIGFARGASTDMLLSSQFSLAMLAWWTWHETNGKLWLCCFYAFLACGMLSKGPVAPGLAVLVIGAYALLRRDKRIFLRSLWWPGFLLFLAIALPWYIAMEIKMPQFFRIFFIEHNLERFGTNLYQHSQPFWYYLPVFLLSMVPWTVFTLMAVLKAVRNKVWQTPAANAESSDVIRLRLFLLLWTIIPILFFSISRSKLPGYILPAIPAAAMLAADCVRRSSLWSAPQRKEARLLLALHSLLCGLLMAAAILAPLRMLKLHPAQNDLLAMLIAGGVTAVVVYLIVKLGGARLLRFATLIPVIVILALALRPGASLIDNLTSARPVDARLRELGIAQEPISVFNVKRQVEYGLNFYRNQPIGQYERDGVPAGEHLLVAQEGSAEAVQAAVGPREVSFVGNFPPQHLEFFLISKK